MRSAPVRRARRTRRVRSARALRSALVQRIAAWLVVAGALAPATGCSGESDASSAPPTVAPSAPEGAPESSTAPDVAWTVGIDGPEPVSALLSFELGSTTVDVATLLDSPPTVVGKIAIRATNETDRPLAVAGLHHPHAMLLIGGRCVRILDASTARLRLEDGEVVVEMPADDDLDMIDPSGTVELSVAIWSGVGRCPEGTTEVGTLPIEIWLEPDGPASRRSPDERLELWVAAAQT